MSKTTSSKDVQRLHVPGVAIGIWHKEKVNLDTPVKRYIKDLKLKDKEVEKLVTIHDSLTHTCGWVGNFIRDETGKVQYSAWADAPTKK